MTDLSYRIIHLKNGTTIYTRDEYAMPSSGDHAPTSVMGLDDQEYHFLDNEVVLTNLSTPESRRKLNELKHGLQAENAAFTHEKMMELEAAMKQAQEAGQQEGQAQRAVDRIMHGARSVVLS